jgi:transposase InsO family protein
VLDEHTRRCLAIEVERRMTGLDVVRTLDALMALYGVVPEHVRCDNGPEFVAAAVRAWLKRSKVRTLYIARGAPWENAYSESFHARLRDEMLNGTELASLSEARATLESWRQEYNEERPHGSLGYKTPAEAFSEACRVGQRCGSGAA